MMAHHPNRRRRNYRGRCPHSATTTKSEHDFPTIAQLLLVLLIISTQHADSFVVSHAIPYSRNTYITRHRNHFPATKSHDAVTESIGTWSLSASNTRGESRFGLRRRVKAVLQNAKNRTGLANLNSEDDYLLEDIYNDEPSLDRAFDDLEEFILREEMEELELVSNELGTNDDPDVAGKSADSSISAATSAAKPARPEIKIKPLPFSLPTLTEEQNQLLLQGERIQYQAKMGREGNGFVVVDVQAPPYVVWECLLDFEAYPEQIDTVRSMQMFTSTHLNSSYISEAPVLPATTRSMRHYGRASVTRASFVLSKFRLNIAAVHKYRPHPDGHYMTFSLDKACKNAVLQDAKGIWYTQACPNGRQDYTRVWLLCELKVSPLLPTFIVDYAARRAMPRATSWLKPVVETSANRWLGTGM